MCPVFFEEWEMSDQNTKEILAVADVCRERDQLKAELAGIRQALQTEYRSPIGDEDILDLMGNFIEHHKEKEAELAQARAHNAALLEACEKLKDESRNVPLCADHAEMWFCERHFKPGDCWFCDLLKWRDAAVELPETNTVVAVFYGAKECDGADIGKWDGQKWILRSLKPESHCGIWKVLGWHPLPESPEHWSFNTIDAAIALENGVV